MVNPLEPVDVQEPAHAKVQHPLKPLSSNGGKPIETNKFYANLLLGSRELPAWPHPYSVWWSRQDNHWGLAISHVKASQRAFAPSSEGKPPQYFLCPTGIQSVNFGASEFSNNAMELHTENPHNLSITVNLTSSHGGGKLQTHLCNGAAFVSATYTHLTPMIQSQVGFESAQALNDRKWKLKLYNGVTWLLYTTKPLEFHLADHNHLTARSKVSEPVTCQVATCADDHSEAIYDASAGMWPVSAHLEADVADDFKSGSYKFVYRTEGSCSSGNTLVFALPHHVSSMNSATQATKRDLQLDSTVMGVMTAYNTNVLEMHEPELPASIGFLPWTSIQNRGEKHVSNYDHDVLNKIRDVASAEWQQDVRAQCVLDSIYFSGKGLGKFANMLIVTKYLLRDDNLARQGLQKLKDAFETFTASHNVSPIVYDQVWGGLVSKNGITNNDPGSDFGNSWYNDHHFHYGYFVHAAAVIAQVDKDLGGNWLESHKDWVNGLVRDYNNPSTHDHYFPEFRSFDWFSGHSLAKGLFLSGDGKDEESSSEDVHASYAIKMWGKVTGNRAMEARGNLMLAVSKRAMNLYMLYSNDNTVEPAAFIKNKVSGIKFENKIDHATYFGLNPEYILGIHMLPTTPASSYVRGPKFVSEEWSEKLASLVPNLQDGWRGILTLDQALFDPSASLSFFKDNFDAKYLDGGMSQTWSLAYAEGCK